MIVSLVARRCGRVVSAGDDGLLRANSDRDADSPSMLRFESHGRRTPWGDHVRYGDDVAVKIKARSGKWRYIDVVKKAPAAKPATERRAAPLVARAQWEERDSTWQKLRVLGFCELGGVPLRAGDKFFLRAVGAAANLKTDVDPSDDDGDDDDDDDDDERVVCAGVGDARGESEAIEALKR